MAVDFQGKGRMETENERYLSTGMTPRIITVRGTDDICAAKGVANELLQTSRDAAKGKMPDNLIARVQPWAVLSGQGEPSSDPDVLTLQEVEGILRRFGTNMMETVGRGYCATLTKITLRAGSRVKWTDPTREKTLDMLLTEVARSIKGEYPHTDSRGIVRGENGLLSSKMRDNPDAQWLEKASSSDCCLMPLEVVSALYHEAPTHRIARTKWASVHASESLAVRGFRTVYNFPHEYGAFNKAFIDMLRKASVGDTIVLADKDLKQERNNSFVVATVQSVDPMAEKGSVFLKATCGGIVHDNDCYGPNNVWFTGAHLTMINDPEKGATLSYQEPKRGTNRLPFGSCWKGLVLKKNNS